MKIILATNFDNMLIPRIAAIDTSRKITDFYGAIDAGPMGGGISHGFKYDGKTLAHIEEHSQLLASYGYSLSYVFNTTCYGNEEFSTAFWNTLAAFLGFLQSIHTSSIVLSNPYLIEKIKKHFPTIKIKASITFGIDTLKKLEYVESLGIDGVVLDDQLNRDFDSLKLIRKAYSGEIVLLANQNCVYSCPYRYSHKSFLSHAACGSSDQLDYSYLLCSLAKMADTSLFLSGRWIRPEDQGIYAELGIDTMKLGMRSYPSDIIFKVIKAYLAEKYEGNLLDILFGNYAHSLQVPVELLNSGRFDDLLDRKAPQTEIAGKIYTAFKLPDYFVRIDNQKLDGFLTFFLTSNCRNKSCEACGFCAGIAKKAVTISDPGLLNRYIALLREIKASAL